MVSSPTAKEIRLNLGCGGRPLVGYINVDMDSLEQLKERYPNSEFPAGIVVQNLDIFNLPYPNGAVDEIRADSLVEHLSFLEEPLFFREVHRVLKPGGIFCFDTPDFEQTVKDWLAAKDEWKDFFRNDPEAIEQSHWFGNYSYSRENRWGYLSAMIFGPQNGAGQFHRNCYTEPKIRAMFAKLGFNIIELSKNRWKGDRDLMISVKAAKK
ncbi:MAG: class I SAM-dependent methyltransferase [Bdellovibrionota bacterium]